MWSGKTLVLIAPSVEDELDELYNIWPSISSSPVQYRTDSHREARAHSNFFSRNYQSSNNYQRVSKDVGLNHDRHHIYGNSFRHRQPGVPERVELLLRQQQKRLKVICRTVGESVESRQRPHLHLSVVGMKGKMHRGRTRHATSSWDFCQIKAKQK